MDEKLRCELRDYAWKYFALHADQRIKTFNFFLVLCTFTTGGLIALLKDAQDARLGAPVALAVTFISFIFWRLDIRNKELIHGSEAALILLEKDGRLKDNGKVTNPLKIFTSEQNATDARKRERFLGFLPRHYSYSTCFNAVFAVFGLAGLIAGITLLLWRLP